MTKQRGDAYADAMSVHHRPVSQVRILYLIAYILRNLLMGRLVQKFLLTHIFAVPVHSRFHVFRAMSGDCAHLCSKEVGEVTMTR